MTPNDIAQNTAANRKELIYPGSPKPLQIPSVVFWSSQSSQLYLGTAGVRLETAQRSCILELLEYVLKQPSVVVPGILQFCLGAAQLSRNLEQVRVPQLYLEAGKSSSVVSWSR